MDRKDLLRMQRYEITEQRIYSYLSRRIKDPSNRRIMEDMSRREWIHYSKLKELTGKDVRPSRIRVLFYLAVSTILGLTFGLKLLERKIGSEISFDGLPIDGSVEIQKDEMETEIRTLNLIDEERLRYSGAIVLGLNDALVELTGALAGFTLALRDPELIAVTGLITGIAASLSMAASAFLSRSEEERSPLSPGKSAVYTGTTYIITVMLLVLPFFLVPSVFAALGITLSIAISLIAIFNYYTSVARDHDFRKRFLRMAAMSLSVAGISFMVGFGLRTILGVNV